MKKIFMLIIVFISVLLFKNSVYAYEEYKVGDLIKYRDEYYFVIADSDEKQNYVTLLKYEPLTQEEIYKYSGGEFDEQYISPARWCNSAETGGDCGYSVNYYNDFKDSYIYLIVNNWASEFSDDLISVDGYKSRIIFIEELINNLGYEEADDDSGGYPKTDDTPFWVYNYNYWTRFMDNSNNRNEITPYYRVGKRLDGAWQRGTHSRIRPVINLDKTAIESCKIKYHIETERKMKSFNKSKELFVWNGFGYYLFEDSDENERYVTGVKQSTLTAEEVTIQT